MSVVIQGIEYFGTKEVGLDILKIRPGSINKAIFDGIVKPPPKDPSGKYLWEIRHIESAAWAMKRFQQCKQFFSRKAKD